MKAEEKTRRLLTTEEAARDWGISKKAIYRMVREGKIRPFVGLKSWRFDPADFNGVLKRL